MLYQSDHARRCGPKNSRCRCLARDKGVSLKVKQRREDFVVREISNRSYRTTGGSFAVYCLEKSGLGTVEALQLAKRSWNQVGHQISDSQIGYGGRKDRHAVTTQTVSIHGGPQEGLEEKQFSLRYLGQAPRAFTAQDIEANEFDLRLRNMTREQATNWIMTSVKLSNSTDAPPIANYFDEQRFGSVGESGEFVARAWCLADYEKALFLALAEPNQHDLPGEVEQKRILRDFWGSWDECKAQLERSNRRSVITYLCDHPKGFKKAAALISRDMRSIYVSAFQSRIWNEMLVTLILGKTDQVLSRETLGGTLACPTTGDGLEELLSGDLPLPSSRPTKWKPEAKKVLQQVCQNYGMAPHQLRFSHPRDVFFSRASRPMFLQVSEFQANMSDDELAGGEESSHNQKIGLKFQLPAGQYATMLVRTLEMHAQQC
ncbi:MAG: tRNA pseudouridine(13) synthase TruD [Planctomycetota bacterium]